MTLSSGQFWFTMFIILIILLFPVIAVRFYNITVHPTLSDRCRIKQRYLRKKALVHSYDPYIRRKSSALRSRRSIRSGYAFAHQEGFGHLITSGKIMRGKTQSYNLNVPNDSKMISTTSNNINSKTNSTNNHNRHHHHHHHHHHRHDQQQQQQHHQSTINQSNRAKVTPISNNKQPSNMI